MLRSNAVAPRNRIYPSRRASLALALAALTAPALAQSPTEMSVRLLPPLPVQIGRLEASAGTSTGPARPNPQLVRQASDAQMEPRRDSASTTDALRPAGPALQLRPIDPPFGFEMPAPNGTSASRTAQAAVATSAAATDPGAPGSIRPAAPVTAAPAIQFRGPVAGSISDDEFMVPERVVGMATIGSALASEATTEPTPAEVTSTAPDRLPELVRPKPAVRLSLTDDPGDREGDGRVAEAKDLKMPPAVSPAPIPQGAPRLGPALPPVVADTELSDPTTIRHSASADDSPTATSPSSKSPSQPGKSAAQPGKSAAESASEAGKPQTTDRSEAGRVVVGPSPRANSNHAERSPVVISVPGTAIARATAPPPPGPTASGPGRSPAPVLPPSIAAGPSHSGAPANSTTPSSAVPALANDPPRPSQASASRVSVRALPGDGPERGPSGGASGGPDVREAKPTVTGVSERPAPTGPSGVKEVAATGRGALTLAPAASVKVTSPHAVQRVEVLDEAVCDCLILGSHDLLVMGRKIGQTRLAVWTDGNAGEPQVVEVRVQSEASVHPLAELADQLTTTIRAAFPEGSVTIEPSPRGLIATGTVQDAEQARAILRLVRRACLEPVTDQLQVR